MRLPESDREWDYADDDRPLRHEDPWRTDDAGIAAENEIDERASIAEEEAEEDEWNDWLDEEDDL